MQYNLSRSKEIAFQGEDKKPGKHKPMRNYEVNIKNIMKLRKKHSVEGSSRVTAQK
jgi:hypothetical protein